MQKSLEKEIKNLSLDIRNISMAKKKKRNQIQSNFMQLKENSNRELFAKVITAFHIREAFSVHGY